MIFIYAFIVCGIICCFCQFLLMNTKLGFPGVLCVLMAIGAATGVTGASAHMAAFAQMGAIAPLSGFAEFAYQCFVGVFNGQYTAIKTIVILCVFLFIFGTVCAVFGKLPPVEKSPDNTEAEQSEAPTAQ